MSRNVTLLTLPNGVAAASFGVKQIQYNYVGSGSHQATYIHAYGLPEYGYVIGTYRSGDATVGWPDPPTVQAGTAVYTYTTNSSPMYIGQIGTTTVTYYSVTTSAGTGGSMSGGGEFTSGTNVTITATPKSGYVVDTLNGVSQSGTGAKSVTVTVTGDMTVYATFKPFYKLAFNANNGSGAPATISPCYANTDYTIPSTEPKRTGYKFIGWATSSSSTTAAYLPGGSYSRSSCTANQTVTLYAVWKRYTLTYDANGGSSTPSAKTYYGNVTLASAITYTGRTFLGWKIGSTIYQAGATYNLTADVTAVAQWTTISFCNDNPAVGTLSLFDVTLNQKVADESDGYVKYSGVSNHVYRVDCSVSDFLYEGRGVYENGTYVDPYQFTFSGTDVTGTYYYNAKPLYAFSVESQHGTYTVSPEEDAAGGLYAKGRTITVNIMPEPGYEVAQATFVNTDNNDVYNKSVDGNVLTLDGIAFNTRAVIDYSQTDYELSAAIDTASESAISAVSVEVGGEAADSAHYGDEASFEATVESGFSFAGWYDADGGNLVSVANPYTPTVHGDIKLVAKASVDVSITLDYTDSDGNETCSLAVNDEGYESGTVFQVVLGGSFSYALTLGMRTEDERWYLDSWKDGDGNTLFIPLSDTITPEEAIEITAYLKPKSATRRTLTVKTGKFGETGGVSVEGEPYSTIGDYAPTGSGATLMGAEPPGQFTFSFYGVQYVKLTAAEQAKIDEEDEFSVFRGFYDDNGVLLTASPSAVVLLASDRTIWAYYGSTAPVVLALGYADADGEAFGDLSVVETSDENATIADNGRSVEVTQGYTVTVRAIPRNGYEFAGWFASDFTGGDPLSTVEGWTRVGDDWRLTVMYGRTIYAKFRKNTHAVCEWEGDPTPKALVWRSKTYEASKPFNPSAARVDSLGYEADSNGSFLALSVEMFSAPDAAPTASAKLDNIKSQNARRLPPMRAERYMQVEVRANVEIDTLLVGTSMGGLAQ